MTLHKALGKILASLKYSTCLRRAYYGNVFGTLVVAEIIIYSLYQRIFRANNNHVNIILDTELLKSLKIISFDSHILSHSSRSGIARSYEQLLTLVALYYLPCKGVLTAAASQQKNFHLYNV